MKKLLIILCCIFAASAYAATNPIHYDPFDGAWFPSGTNALMFQPIHGASNVQYTDGDAQRNIKFEQNVILFRYARWQDVLGRSTYFGVIVPVGDVSIVQNASTPAPTVLSASGLGDTSLVISPLIVQWESGYLNFNLEVVVPTGVYKYASMMNMGDNRYNGKAGFTLGQNFGALHIDYWLIYELYTDNTDARDQTGQKATLAKEGDLFSELHLAYTLNQESRTYASLSFGGIWGGREQYKYSGGVKSSKFNNLNDYAVQIGLGTGLTRDVILSAHYLYDLKKENGFKGYQVQAKIMFLF